MTIDLNTALGELNSQTSFDLSPITSFLNKIWEAHKIKRLSSVDIDKVHADIAQTNLSLVTKIVETKTILLLVKKSKPEPRKADLNKLISYYDDEIEKIGKLTVLLDGFFNKKGSELFADLKTTNSLLFDFIDAAYEIIRYFKKINKRTNLNSSQLAEDTASYSFTTLSTILNGH